MAEENYSAYRQKQTDGEANPNQDQFAPGAKLRSYARKPQTGEPHRAVPDTFVEQENQHYARPGTAQDEAAGEAEPAQFAHGATISAYRRTADKPAFPGTDSEAVLNQIAETEVERSGVLYHYLSSGQRASTQTGEESEPEKPAAASTTRRRSSGNAESNPQPPIQAYRPAQPLQLSMQPILSESPQPELPNPYQSQLTAQGMPPQSPERYFREKKRKRRRTLWTMAAGLVAAMAVLGLVFGLMGEKKPEQVPEVQPEATAAVFVPRETPIPAEPEIKGFNYGTQVEMSDAARDAIVSISGPVQMENAFVTPANVVTRSLREDGLYDFYVFDAKGELLCYFDGLGKAGVRAGEGDTLYAAQKPYLLRPDGSPLLTAGQLQQLTGGNCLLMPIHYGWSLIQRDTDAKWNMVDAQGSLLVDVWMDELYPFTGEYTLGCMDTGNIGSEERYVWYILSRDGVSTRWFAAAEEKAVAAAFCDLAYFADGRVFDLARPNQMIQQTARAVVYPDLGATVLYDDSGRCGLWRQGKYCYECRYESIQPVEDETAWDMVVSTMPNVGMRVYTLNASLDRRPISCTFALNDGASTEYAALSVVSAAAYDAQDEFTALSR